MKFNTPKWRDILTLWQNNVDVQSTD